MKKIIALLLVVVMLFALCSCGLSRKPEGYKKALEKKFDDDIEVDLIESETEIKYLGMLFGIDYDDVTAVLAIEHEDHGVGYVIYCEKSKDAKEVKEDCLDVAEEDDDIIVKKSGKAVFIGEEDLWKKIKGV